MNDGSIRHRTVSCRYCGAPTRMIETGLCLSCWELARRIRYTPDIAARIFAELKAEQELNEHPAGTFRSASEGVGRSQKAILRPPPGSIAHRSRVATLAQH